jgi:hypothetical protein
MAKHNVLQRRIAMSKSNYTTNEIWKTVSIMGFEVYEVSNIGRLRRNGRIRKTHSCLGNNGYIKTTLYSVEGNKITFSIHRLVAITFIGDPPSPRHEVNHINCDRKDNRPENLEWVTRKENMEHSKSLGRIQKGENHFSKRINGKCNYKLSKSDVMGIRYYHRKGFLCKDIAERYGISTSYVSSVATGKQWSSIAISR